MKRGAAAIVVSLAIACASAPPPQPQPADQLRGTASWYGQEYAGRTTANGEIFDPWQFTAAHRTLPFGTVVDVKGEKSGQTVRVRINDRGPYINDRLIDLSYAAAAKIGLVEPGTGLVELTIVRLGKGDREPPAPYIVTVPELKPVPQAASAEAPATSVEDVPVVASEAKPVQDSATIETRRQVSADGKRVEEVPVGGTSKPAPAPAPVPRRRVTPPPAPVPASKVSGKFLVQVGAFALEPNAKLLLEQVTRLGITAYIDHGQLFYVRIGPFGTRDEAVKMRGRLESAGLSAIVLTQ